MAGYVAMMDQTVDPPVAFGAANPIPVTLGTAGNKVQGVDAQNTPITSNPVPVGGLGSNAVPAAVTSPRVAVSWLTPNGAIVVGGWTGAAANGRSNSQVEFMDMSGTPRCIGVNINMSNGTTMDSVRKPNLYKRVASSAAAGNPDFIKASAGDLMQFWGQCGATAAFLQVYNKASTPTIGTDTPILTYPIPANAVFSQTIPNGGAYLGTGVAFAFTTDAAGTTGSAAAAITACTLLAA